MSINSTSAQVLATSSSKAVNMSFKTGKLNMNSIALYHLISYYASFTEGKPQFNLKHEFLLNKLDCVKNTYRDICNYKTILLNDSSIVTNTAPTTTNKIVDIEFFDLYQFKLKDFINFYNDAESHNWKYLKIYPDPLTNGYIYKIVNGNIVPITTIQEINVENITLNNNTGLNLFYDRSTVIPFKNDIFRFKISDNPIDYLYSIFYTMNVTAFQNMDGFNSIPVVGDNTIYVANRVETILTLDMFTTDTTLPYSDPENDLLDAIRIDEISLENIGKFLLNDIEISVGDIITREQLLNNEFKHIGPDQNAVSSDVFHFSARDEGSLIWVN